MRSRAPRPGLLGAQGRRRRKANEEGGEDEQKKKEGGGQDGRGGERLKEGEIRWEAKDRREDMNAGGRREGTTDGLKEDCEQVKKKKRRRVGGACEKTARTK